MSVFPLATVPVASSYPPTHRTAPFADLITLGGEGQYLLEISAYKGGEVRSGGLETVAEGPVANIPRGGGVNVGLVRLFYGDRHWVGAPTDPDAPNRYYEGRVLVPLAIDRTMPLLPEDSRRAQRQFGFIEFANGDGLLDPIMQSYSVDGRQVRVLFGPLGGAYADFGVIADLIGTGWEGDEIKAKLGVRDRTYSLDLPLQTNLYAGTGGAEGTAENEGRTKPLCFGPAPNITPTLIDPVNLIYQWHDGVGHAVTAVYDRAAALTDSGINVASYAALVAQVVPAGNWATANAVSMFKLGSSPAGLITADVQGDASPSYIDTLDQIAIRILNVRAGLALSWIDRASFAGAAAIGGAMGIYIASGQSPTTADVIDVLMAATAAWWGPGARDGRVRAGRLTAPEDRSPSIYLDQYHILDLTPEVAPVPRWRQRVTYSPNWTEQRGEDLASAVTAARRQFLTESSRVVASADALVKLRHLLALDPPPLQSLYANASDAQRLSDYLLELFGPDRRIFSAKVKRLGYQLDYGAIVRVTYPKFRLNGGQNFSVIGIRDDADREETILRIWG